MKIIAHRGARSLAPENTLSAFMAAQKLPADLIEGDVTLTADNRAVMIHQETLQPSPRGERLELAPRNEGRAWVLGTRWEELSAIDAGSWFDVRFCHERIPLLESVLALPWSSKGLLLDLIDPYYWSNENDKRMCERFSVHVVPILRDAVEQKKNISVLAFNPNLLELFQRELPQVNRTFAVWTNQRGKERWVATKAQELGVKMISIADFMLRDEPQWEEAIRIQGFQLGVYEVTPDTAPDLNSWIPEKRVSMWDLVIEKGVDAFTTDFPSEFAAYYKTKTATSQT